jgi:hypothetical protein
VLRIRAAAALALAALAFAGCGGSDDGEGTRNRPAPPAADFPAAQGKTLEQVLSASSGEGPVVSPAARVLREGNNRFPFGVFTLGHEQIADAQVAIYAAPGAGLSGPAIGPFPARIVDLTTEPAFRAKTTTDDPDAAQVAYVSEIPLNRPGPWSFGALTKEGDSFKGSLLPTEGEVGQFDTPAPGDEAPMVHTPTADQVPDISEIDTRVPPSDMHTDDLADVLGKKPVVLLFATPALCQSRVCGPVVDVAAQVKRDFGDRVAFIHQEIYENNSINDGPRPQVEAYRLPSEPWLFVIDRNGRVSTAIEGPFGVGELEAAVRRVAGT